MKNELPDEEVALKICYGKLHLPIGCGVSNGDELVLTSNIYAFPGLSIYTKKQWASIMDQLHHPRLKRHGKKIELLRRLVIGNAEDCVVKAGEIQISSHLVKLAGLHNKVILIKRPTRIEIWDPTILEEWKQSQEGSRK